jgi:hypothetical protein
MTAGSLLTRLEGISVTDTKIQSEICHNHHHREQQDDRREVDGLQRLLRSDDDEGDHQHGADNRRSRPIDLHPRELAEGKDKIAASENRVCGQDSCVGKQRRTEVGHGGSLRSVREHHISGLFHLTYK